MQGLTPSVRAPVQNAVAYSFADMGGGQFMSAGKVGNGTRYPENAVVGAGRQAQLVHGAVQQLLCLLV